MLKLAKLQRTCCFIDHRLTRLKQQRCSLKSWGKLTYPLSRSIDGYEVRDMLIDMYPEEICKSLVTLGTFGSQVGRELNCWLLTC